MFERHNKKERTNKVCVACPEMARTKSSCSRRQRMGQKKVSYLRI